jgi:threonyl-tRNA synthetase
LKRIPYMLIVGEKEAENREVAVRRQGEGDMGTMSVDAFEKLITEEVERLVNQYS